MFSSTHFRSSSWKTNKQLILTPSTASSQLSSLHPHSPLCWLWPSRWSRSSSPSSSSPLQTQTSAFRLKPPQTQRKPKKSSARKQEAREERFLTESLVHHGFLLLFLTLLIQQRAEGVPDGDTLGFSHCGKGKERPTMASPPSSTSGYWPTVATET